MTHKILAERHEDESCGLASTHLPTEALQYTIASLALGGSDKGYACIGPESV